MREWDKEKEKSYLQGRMAVVIYNESEGVVRDALAQQMIPPFCCVHTKGSILTQRMLGNLAECPSQGFVDLGGRMQALAGGGRDSTCCVLK